MSLENAVPDKYQDHWNVFKISPIFVTVLLEMGCQQGIFFNGKATKNVGINRHVFYKGKKLFAVGTKKMH